VIVVGDAVGQWVAEAVNVKWLPSMTAVGWQHKGELVAGILYEMYTGPGGSIGMHSRVTDPSKVTRQWLFAIFDYPFNQLKCDRVNGMVPAENHAALAVDLKLGFELEAVLKGYYPTCDAYILVMWRERCRWLRYKRKDTSHGRQEHSRYP